MTVKCNTTALHMATTKPAQLAYNVIVEYVGGH